MTSYVQSQQTADILKEKPTHNVLEKGRVTTVLRNGFNGASYRLDKLHLWNCNGEVNAILPKDIST